MKQLNGTRIKGFALTMLTTVAWVGAPDAADAARSGRTVSLSDGARLTDGRFGYVSEVWIHTSHRDGLGLPGC